MLRDKFALTPMIILASLAAERQLFFKDDRNIQFLKRTGERYGMLNQSETRCCFCQEEKELIDRTISTTTPITRVLGRPCHQCMQELEAKQLVTSDLPESRPDVATLLSILRSASQECNDPACPVHGKRNLARIPVIVGEA